ncbi:MAG: hypothetical protein FWJ93_12665 [Micromonosporaceae bacterium]
MGVGDGLLVGGSSVGGSLAGGVVDDGVGSGDAVGVGSSEGEAVGVAPREGEEVTGGAGVTAVVLRGRVVVMAGAAIGARVRVSTAGPVGCLVSVAASAVGAGGGAAGGVGGLQGPDASVGAKPPDWVVAPDAVDPDAVDGVPASSHARNWNQAPVKTRRARPARRGVSQRDLSLPGSIRRCLAR